MVSRRPVDEAPPSGILRYVLAGGIVVASLFAFVATRDDQEVTSTPTSTPRPAPVVKVAPNRAPQPPHLEEIRKLTVLFNSSMESTAARDALYARAKIHAEHKDYRSATDDLRRLLYRRDVTGPLRQEIDALLRKVESDRRAAGR